MVKLDVCWGEKAEINPCKTAEELQECWCTVTCLSVAGCSSRCHLLPCWDLLLHKLDLHEEIRSKSHNLMSTEEDLNRPDGFGNKCCGQMKLKLKATNSLP